MYNFTIIFQDKADSTNYFTLPIVAYTKTSLNRQILMKRPDGFRYVRTVKTKPGHYTDLNPKMPDMALISSSQD